MKILVIDCDAAASQIAVEALKKLGDCDCAHVLSDGIYTAGEVDYDLIVTETIFPQSGGLNAVKELVKVTDSPIIALSAEQSVLKRIDALRSGADDFIVKPYVADELLARAEVALRRRNGKESNVYSKDGLQLDFKNKILKIDGQIVKLSLRKYEILEYLISRRNVIISKERLYNRIWGADQDTVFSVVEVYISELRKLLRSYGREGQIRTINGMGYMWLDK